LRERYDAVQSRHGEILRAAFDAHDGHEIDTQGDAFFAAFGRARDAVAAAVEAQRALAGEEWPDGATVRVRMGLHTGEPLVGGERYVGMGVNRGARICAAAHGGQVLLSNTTRELVEDDLPDDVRVVDLGEHRLKDLPRPERIFQLEIAGLPSSFPPLRTGDVPTLVEGREPELARAAAVALPSRLTRRPGLLAVAAILVAGAIVAAFVVTANGPTPKVAANSVAAIDPSGTIKASVPVGATPAAMTATPGALWVANLDDQTVTHVDPRTGQAVRTISVGDTPSGIASDDSSVWVAAGANGIEQIDPRYDRVTSKRIVKTLGSGFPTASIRPAVNAFGSLWVVHSDGYVQRVNPTSLDLVTTVDVGNGPSAIAAGAGSLWVTNGDDGTVTRIDPTTLVTTTIPVGHGPDGISVNADGAWVANSGEDALVRINLTTNAVDATTTVGNAPGAVAATPQAVWVANGGDGTVMRIDPKRAKVTKKIHLGGAPTALAVADGRIWAAVEAAAPQAPAQGGLARFLTNISFGSVDPAEPSTESAATTPLLYATCASLVTYPDKLAPEGSRIVPEVAEAVPPPSQGGTTYTFKLRRGFRFSPPSNEPVTAAAFKTAIERITNPRTKSFSASLFSDISGFAAYSSGKASHLSGVIALGQTLTIRLSRPNGGFLANLASAPTCAVPIGTPVDPRGSTTFLPVGRTTLRRTRRTGNSSSSETPTTTAAARTGSTRSSTRSASIPRVRSRRSKQERRTTPLAIYLRLQDRHW
jgi:YVTN family beta-propeller protein